MIDARLKKMKYLTHHNKVYLEDTLNKYKGREMTKGTVYIGYNKDMGIVEGMVKIDESLLTVSELRESSGKCLSEVLTENSKIYYDATDITYIIESVVAINKEGVMLTNSIKVHLMQLVEGEIYLQDVTYQLPRELQNLLKPQCIAFTKARMGL